MSLQCLPESPGFAPWSWQLQLFTLARESLGTGPFSSRPARVLWGLLAVEVPAFPTSPALCSQQRFHVECFFHQESRSLVSLPFSPLKLHGNNKV